MSICVASDEELRELCTQTLAVHGSKSRDGIADEAIVELFRAIRIAQHAAYGASYDEEIMVPAMEFPVTASPHAVLHSPAFHDLYENLTNLGYNTVDRAGDNWLPEKMERRLTLLRIRTATKAARF